MRNPLHRMPTPSDRAMRVMGAVLLVLVLAVITTTVLDVRERTAVQSQRLDDARDQRDRLASISEQQADDIAAQSEAISDANARLKRAGKKPVTVKDQPAAKPTQGVPTLTSDDVLALIEAEVAVQRPTLTDEQRASIVQRAAVAAAERIPEPQDGEDGRDGPTVEDMAPIVAAEVAKIPAPVDGVDGQDGRTPTQEEVAAALTALCGGSCKGEQGDPGAKGDPGPTGPAGADGSDGQDGRGITSITCTDGVLVVTWTTGEQERISGSTCTTTTPEPTPTPSETSPTSTASPQG